MGSPAFAGPSAAMQREQMDKETKSIAVDTILFVRLMQTPPLFPHICSRRPDMEPPAPNSPFAIFLKAHSPQTWTVTLNYTGMPASMSTFISGNFKMSKYYLIYCRMYLHINILFQEDIFQEIYIDNVFLQVYDH
jgi:hypothetical protein